MYEILVGDINLSAEIIVRAVSTSSPDSSGWRCNCWRNSVSSIRSVFVNISLAAPLSIKNILSVEFSVSSFIVSINYLVCNEFKPLQENECTIWVTKNHFI